MTATHAEDDLASQVTHDRPAEKRYRRALAFFLGSLIASAIPAFLSDGVDLLDPPWQVAAPITALFIGFALVRARGAARELRTRVPRRRVLHVVMLYAMAVLFAGLGGATIAWETTRLLDHRLDRAAARPAVASRIAVHRGGRGTAAEYALQPPERSGSFSIRADDPPATIEVEVHPGALGYRWVVAE